ncbi:polysaccharide deacetylase family protein [Haladaptatus sp. GCM10025707]|uniref:polysaccharide deacetylase family protein n=1 Tax=unclassified Haladaptatus TaxID=2622732 RepID=UPI0023E84569|nr:MULTISPECIES: polysaccharide deacetylase family protein [unclassified Haladaptatus]
MTGAWDALASSDRRLRLSSRFPDRRNAILVYHSVGMPGRFGTVSVERFRRDLDYLTSRYTVCDLPDVLESGTKKRVAITFDDGFADFETNTLPLLREFDCPATVFVSSDFVGDENLSHFAARHELEPTADQVMLTAAQLRALATDPLVTVGNHTRSHPRLSELGDDEARREEILGAKAALETIVGVEIDRFSYPYGDHDPASVVLVRDSHALAVTTAGRLVAPGSDPYLLPRLAGHVPESTLRWELSDLGDAIRTATRRINGRLTMPSRRV